MKKDNSLKILTLLVFILVINNNILFSQSCRPFCFGITTALNNSKLYDGTINLDYAARPALGLFARPGFSEKFYIKTSLLASKRASVSLSPGYYDLVNTYLDLNLIPQLKFFNCLYLQAGVCYSIFLKSKYVIPYGESWNGLTKIDNGVFKSELNLTTGIELQLSRIMSFEFNYTIPTAPENTKNFQFSLNFVLNDKSPKKESYRRKRRTKSKEQIKQLKKGTLLVMLGTERNKINALRNVGKGAKADSVELRQKRANNKIIDAFNKHFTFCNVAFFNTENIMEIKNKQFANVFLNDSLTIDKSISIDTSKPIFIATFTNLEQDTMKYFSHYGYGYGPNGDHKKVERYYTPSSDINFIALVIKDENFVQLNRPFPYYTRAMFISENKHPEQGLFLWPTYPFQNWSYDETVEEMNEKLQKYFGKNEPNKK